MTYKKVHFFWITFELKKKYIKMVRSLAQWTKSLSFPSRLSPNRNSKDCSGVNIHQVNPPPTPPRNNKSNNSSSPSPSHNNNNNNVPITEINQIVSAYFWIFIWFLHFLSPSSVYFNICRFLLNQWCFSGDFRSGWSRQADVSL